MHRRFKLRLSDGTILLVDQDGLKTWRVDAKAMVQSGGGKWHPLKDVLARQEAAAKHASRLDPSAPVPPPLIHPKPPPLIHPKPREDKPPPGPVAVSPQPEPSPRPAPPPTPPPKPPARKPPREPVAPSSRDLVKPPSVSKPARVQARAKEPRVPGGGHVPPTPTPDEVSPIIPSNPLAEDGAPLLSEAFSQGEPPHLEAWADEPAIPSTEPFPQPSPPIEVEEVAAIPPMPVADEAPPILDTFSQSEAPRVATSEPLDLRALAEETLAQVSPPIEVEEVEAIPPAPIADETPEIPAPSPWHEPVEASPVAARPSLQALADDPAPRAGYTRERPALDDELPSIPLKPVETRDEKYAHASTRPGVYESGPDDFVERSARGHDLEQQFVRAVKAFSEFLSRSGEHLGHVYRQLQPAFRDALAWSRGALARLPEVLARAREVLAALREAMLKWRAARSSRSVPQKAQPSLDVTPEVRALAQEPTEWPALISSPSVPQEPHRSLVVAPEVQALAQEPTEWRGEEPERRAIGDEEIPIIHLKPVRDYRAPWRAVQTLFRRFGSGASTWAVGLKGRVEGLVRRNRPGRSVPSSEPAEPSPPYWAPREQLKAPPSTRELPVLRLAKIHEPEEAEDVYEGGRESPFPDAWLWAKRTVLVTGLVVAVVVAARGWGTWFPKVARLGGTAFTEINEYIQTREQKQRERQALQEATEQLPHLAPDTIRLVLSRSPTGVLDPAELFKVSSDAVDRGVSALTPQERQELKELRSTLLGALSPSERERVREYDEVRARRLPFEFEDQRALELFARGARALPSDGLERLQTLFGKTIASGLPRPIEVAPGAGAKR